MTGWQPSEAAIDLEEGTEVLVSMDGAPRDLADATAADGASLLDLIEELHASALVREPGDRPVDLAEHYKHYLYRQPKGEEL